MATESGIGPEQPDAAILVIVAIQKLRLAMIAVGYRLVSLLSLAANGRTVLAFSERNIEARKLYPPGGSMAKSGDTPRGIVTKTKPTRQCKTALSPPFT